ncbi:MAG TPA: NADPH-dependent FMN reductase [Chthoniobacterales bacterium]|jgi:FMN reductase
MKVTILSCSLDPNSKSRILAEAARLWLRQHDREVTLLDLRDFPLPDFDNAIVLQHPNYTTIRNAILEADSVVIASPVYNWD